MAAQGQLIAVVVVDLGHHAGSRAQHAAFFLRNLTQPGVQAVPEHRSSPEYLSLLLTGEGDQGEIPEGRRRLSLAQADFQIIKPIVILLCRKADDLMLRLKSLNHRPTGAVASACPTHHLGKHIEGGLPCPEASGIEA